MEELTVGQQLVGANFNPSQRSDVERIKQLYAEIIDLLNATFQDQEVSDTKEAFLEAATLHIITAQMWSVKAITYDYW